jgi:hypothetical protein
MYADQETKANELVALHRQVLYCCHALSIKSGKTTAQNKLFLCPGPFVCAPTSLENSW